MTKSYRLFLAGMILRLTLCTFAPPAHGQIFVSFPANNTIQQFTTAGVSSPFASGLNSPQALAFDSAGLLYVANANASTIVRFLAVPAPGVSQTGVAFFTGNNLFTPFGLAFDGAGLLYVGNGGNNTIRTYPGGSLFASTSVNGPNGMAFDSTGNLYVANRSANNILMFPPGSSTPTVFASALSGLRDLAWRAGVLYVVNGGSTILEFATPTGTPRSSTFVGVSDPRGLAFDCDGNLYVTGGGAVGAVGGTITKFNSTGGILWSASTGSNTPGFIAIQLTCVSCLPMINPSFEVDTFTVLPGYTGNGGANGPITGWTSAGNVGVNPVAGATAATANPFSDNGTIPDGKQVAFMQEDRALSQTVSGFTVGAQYYVHYYENSRGWNNGTLPFLEVKIGGITIVAAHPVSPVGGSNPYHHVISSTFTATATSLELAFIKSNPQGDDTTALIDNVCITPLLCVPPPSGMVAWWPGDGNATDIAGPNNGVLTNGATFATGKVGSAFAFDGVDDYLQAPTTGLPTGANARTMDLWVKIDAFVAPESFFAGYGNFGVSGQAYVLGTLGNALFFSQWGTGVGGPPLATNTWYHIAVTTAANVTTLYTNGVAVGSATNLLMNTPSGSRFYMGRIPGPLGDNQRLKGEVDEIEVFNRALTQPEIAALFNAGSAGKCKPSCAIPLVVNCATNKVVSCGSNWTFDLPTAASCCSTNVTLTILSTVTNGVCPQIITRTWTATDACTNSVTCTQTVTVLDTTPPVFTCATNKTVLCGAVWNFDTPTATDICSPGIVGGPSLVPVTILNTVTNGLCPMVITRSWMARDLCGNTNTCSQTVTVLDTTPPVLTCSNPTTLVFSAGTTNDDFVGLEPAFPSAGLLVGLNAAGVTSLKGFDDCTLNTLFVHSFTNLPSCISGATLHVRLRACGSALNDIFGLSFTSPSGVLLPPDWSRYLGSGNSAPGLFNISWGAGSTREVMLDLSQLPNADGSITDLIAALNTQRFLDLTLQDDTSIDFAVLTVTSCCANGTKTVECGTAWTFDAPIVSDSCSGTNVTVAILSTVTNGLCPQIITRTWKATDACGNSITNSQTVTVVNTTPPVITCPTNKTVQCNSNWTFDPPTVLSVCSGTNVSITVVTNMTFLLNPCLKQVVRIWQVSDACSNSVTCSQVVTVFDTTPPVLTCLSNKIVQCNSNWDFDLPTVVDNCLGTNATLTIVGTVTNSINPLVITRTWQAADCNNAATCSQTVTVLCPTNLCVPPPTNMVLWLPFDETSGAISTNLVPGGNNGMQVNGPVITSGFVGNSLTFSGVNLFQKYVEVPSYNAINFDTNDFSIDAWVRRATNDPGTSLNFILDKRASAAQTGTGFLRGYSFFLQIGGQLEFHLADGNSVSSSYISNPGMTVPIDGQWHHLAVTVDRDNTNGVVFYLNGVAGTGLNNPVPHSGSVSTAMPLRVGSREPPLSGNFLGSIDEVELFSRVLAPTEIAALFNAGSAGKCKTPYAIPLVVNCATNKTVNCGTVWAFDEPTAVTSCSGGTAATAGMVNITILSTVTNSLCPMVFTRTWVATDACTNSVTCSQTVTVLNTNLPVMLSLTNIVVTSCTSNQVFFTATATDTCNTNLTVVFTPPSGSFFAPGTTTTVTGVASNCVASVSSSFTVTVLCGITNICVPAPTNMVLWLPFDETSGTVSANLVPGGLNGMQVNGPVITSGFVANSLSFNGTTQYVEVPSYDAINFGTNDFSIDAWVRRAANDPGNLVCAIVDKRVEQQGTAIVRGYGLFLDGGLLKLQLADGTYTNYSSGLVVPNNGQWHHVAVTVDRDNASGIRFYLDGLADTTTNNPMPHSGSVSSLPSLHVGSIFSTMLKYFFLGSIDEVELFNRVLAPAEIAALFNAGSAGKCKMNCTTPLVVNCPTNKTVSCGVPWKFDLPTVSGTNLTIISTSILTNGVCPQVITQTWLITDACGNTQTCSQAVTLADTVRPTIECPTDTIVVALDKNCLLEIPTIRPHASDNCTPLTQLIYTQNPLAGAMVPGPCQVVTVTVMDACGNFNQCQVRVCGLDRTPPTLVCPPSVTVTNCIVPDILALVTASDDCTPTNLLHFSQSPAAGTPMAAGGNSVTVTVTDQAGNTAICVISLITSGPQSFLDVLFNTGVNASKAILGVNVADPHYTLGPVPAGTPTGAGFYQVPVARSGGFFFGPPGPTASIWIGPWFTAGPNPPLGSYTYTNEFILPQVTNPTASISGRWVALSGAEMYLNGSHVASTTYSNTYPANFTSWTYFTINSGFLPFPAVNKLTFVVTRGTNSFSTGLRVEFTQAIINCTACTPPVILLQSPDQSLPLGGSAMFNVAVWGTPPLIYQWYRNGLPLSNGGHYSGVNTPILSVTSLSTDDAGNYHAVISNSCGEIASIPRKLTVSHGRPWWWAWWRFAEIGNPKKATVGPDLIMEGTNQLATSSGNSFDFGLPNLGGQLANVIYVPPLPGDTLIKLPVVGTPGGGAVSNYTVIMDVYAPTNSTGSATLFSIFDRWGNLKLSSSRGAAGEALRVSGMAGGRSFNLDSTTLLPRGAWNRIALVVKATPSIANLDSEIEALTSLFVNGKSAGSTSFKISPGTLALSSNSVATLLSSPEGTSGETYTADVQFHATAMTSEMMVGVGAPDQGPLLADDSSLGMVPVLAGAVKYYTLDKRVPGVTIDLLDGGGVKVSSTNTDSNGTFNVSVAPVASLTLTPSKATETPPSQGVTTLDITLVRRHILGIASLDSPYKILAGDVNGSSSVTTLDITLIRRVILGITNAFPVRMWKFVRSDYSFGDPLVPWSAEAVRSYTNLNAQAVDQDFVGIKLGDVNGSWTSASAAQQSLGIEASGSLSAKSVGAVPGNRRVKLNAKTPRFVAGATGKIGVALGGFDEVSTAQFTLQWDPKVMEFNGTSEYGLPGMGAENFGVNRVSDGRLTFSWDDVKGANARVEEGEQLFAVEFKVMAPAANGTVIELVDGPTRRELTVGLKSVSFSSEQLRLTAGDATGDVAPKLSLNPSEGLKISGAVGSKYRIEYAEEIGASGGWKELRTVVLSSGEETVPMAELLGATNRFYRAVWVP